MPFEMKELSSTLSFFTTTYHPGNSCFFQSHDVVSYNGAGWFQFCPAITCVCATGFYGLLPESLVITDTQMSARLPGHAKLLWDCEAIPPAHTARVAAGRKAGGHRFCDDFQAAEFSVSIALSGLFFPLSVPAFLLPVPSCI
jgi:hypothetical protein